MESYPGCQPRDHQLDISGLVDQFGPDIKTQEFMLSPDVAFFNHGSYGTVPRRVLDTQIRYMKEREEHPDLWYRLNAQAYLDKTRRAVADFVGADVDNLVLVNNATTAINTTVKSFPFKPGQAILDTTLTYGSVQNLLSYFTTCLRPDVTNIKINLELPIKSESDVIQKYEEALQQHPEIKLVIIDHITSPSSVVMPVKKLVDLCHRHGALVLVDGAHAIGQLPLDLNQLGADVYTSNMHKWLYAPRGSAFLWFDSQHADWIRPSNTSWKMGLSLDKQFFDQGTGDHIPFICARHGLEFYHAIGGMDRILSYTSSLANRAKEILATEVGLQPLEIPESMEAPNIKFLKLPSFPKFPVSKENAWKLHVPIFGDSKVFGLVIFMCGAIYIRISIQVYNDIKDVRELARVLRKFISHNV